MPLNNDDHFLHCDEALDHPSPMHSHNHTHDYALRSRDDITHPITKQDLKRLFDNYVLKETKYMTGSGYVKFLQSNRFVVDCRVKAIHWFIHCMRRFGFCRGTVFNAVNYVDRFVDANKCNIGWSDIKMELLSLAAMYIAVKFGETGTPYLYQIQHGLEHTFETKLVEKMEEKLLKTLKWEVNPITPYSYVELIEWELKQRFMPIDRARLGDVLLSFSFDFKLLEYRPCVIAISGLKFIVEYEHCVPHMTTFIPADQRKEIQSCYNKMKEILFGYPKSESSKNSSTRLDTGLMTKESKPAVCFEPVVLDGPAIKRKRVDGCVIKNKK